MEDQTVVPHDDGRHEAAHAEDIDSLVPAQAVRVQPSLHNNTKVHEVAEVQHVVDVLWYLYERRRVISPK